MIDGQTILNIRETNSYQSEEIRSMKDRIRLLETQEFPFVRIRDFDAKGNILVGTADNAFDQLGVGANDTILIADSAKTMGVKWGTIATAGITDLSVTTAKLADNAVTTIKITDANVTNAKLANMAAATVKGRALGAGTGVPVDLTATQLNAIVGSTDLTLAGKYVATGVTASYDLYNQSTNAASVRFLSDVAGVLRIQNIVGAAVNRATLSSTGDFEAAGGVTGTGRFISKGTSASFDLYNQSTNAASMRLISDVAGVLRIQDITGAATNRTTIDTSGNLTTSGYVRGAYDTDVASGLGRAAVGYAGWSDYASFAHIDCNNTTDYAFLQDNLGESFFNAKSGKTMHLRIANTDVATITTGLLAMTGDITVSDDLTVTDLATVGSLGVGIATLDSTAHIHAASAGTVTAASSTVLTLENSGDLGLSMLVPANYVQRIYFGDADDNDINQFSCYHLSNSFRWRLDNTDRIRLSSSENSLQPANDVGQSLGSSSFRWNEVWALDGSINTSDEREKRNVKPSDLGLDFITRLQPISWVWQDKPAYEIEEEPGDKQIVPARTHKRPHYGLGAQQVRKVLDDLGVADFAGYIHDAEADVYALRYSEFIGPLIMAVQELAEQIKEKKN